MIISGRERVHMPVTTRQQYKNNRSCIQRWIDDHDEYKPILKDFGKNYELYKIRLNEWELHHQALLMMVDK